MSADEKKQPVKKGKEESGIAPLRPEDIMHHLDRMFDDFQGRLESTWGPHGYAWTAPRPRLFGLPGVRHAYADLIDAGKEYRVLVEVPGVSKDKLKVSVTSNEIRIEGEAKTDIHDEKEGFVRQERGYTKLTRTMVFPEPVVGAKAEASMNNGLLEVRVPKKNPTESTAHRVSVK